MSIDLLLDKLREQNVCHVRPLFSGQGSDKRTHNYVLTFRGKTLPKHVYVGKERRSPRPYRAPIIQCKNCWWFGHTADNCIKKKTCEFCASKDVEHTREQCARMPPKCRSCLKAHKASSKHCPVWRKQTAIAKLRSEHNVGYRSASEIFAKANRNKTNGPKSPHVPDIYVGHSHEVSSDSEESAGEDYRYRRALLHRRPKKPAVPKPPKSKSLFSITDSSQEEVVYTLGLDDEPLEASQVLARKRRRIGSVPENRLRQDDLPRRQIWMSLSLRLNLNHLL